MKKSVLVVHQSAELYGSDRSLLDFLLDQATPVYQFIVCLPEDGPLRIELSRAGIETHVIDVIKVSRKMFTFRGLVALPKKACYSVKAINKVVDGRKVAFVYSNTVAVLGGAIWAFFAGKPHVWHIREIIKKPLPVTLFFQWMIRFFATKTICNSQDTANWADAWRGRKEPSRVVWNGVDFSDPLSDGSRAIKKEMLGFDPALPVLLMIGRVNAWKGQDLLLDALDILAGQGNTEFSIAFVGGAPPNHPEFIERLQERVMASTMREKIKIFSFTKDIQEFYEAGDLVVVPSKEPEPFGRVAIEAMAVGLPVIVAGHGGLLEIVENERTGLIFTPNDASALAKSLARLLKSDALRKRLGAAGRQRQIDCFSINAYRKGILAVFNSVS